MARPVTSLEKKTRGGGGPRAVDSGKVNFSLSWRRGRKRASLCLWPEGGREVTFGSAAAALLPYMRRVPGSPWEPHFDTEEQRGETDRNWVSGVSSWIKSYLEKVTSGFFI